MQIEKNKNFEEMKGAVTDSHLCGHLNHAVSQGRKVEGGKEQRENGVP